VRPGSLRLGVTGLANGTRCLAFKSLQDVLIAELINSLNTSNQINLEFGAQSLRLTLAPVSITTCLWRPEG
jgi:hypothetical protein